MSKDVKQFFTKIGKDFNMGAKLKASYNAGNRIVPSRTQKNDQAYQCRLDAGELVDDQYRNVVLQVNSEVKATGLKLWLQKNGTHAKLAMTRFDTKAEDPDGEADKVMAELQKQALEKI
ncbi:MAG: hypothetical protein M1821_008714 [Bathelium mastoideum]|nr:MAG: hypothetical protein M1821_008714 [Bathelium mastoideum]KAI9685874.1 MAG: hypothetical protein M1822_004152 [Bathelium mastoideum]